MIVIKKTELAKTQPLIENMAALAILLVSVVGAVIWGAGGWEDLSSGRGNLAGLLAALLVQALCILFQWMFADRVFSWPYITALAVSTTTTVLGYAPIVAPPISAWIAGRFPSAAPLADLGTNLIIVLVAALADIVPERRFVR